MQTLKSDIERLKKEVEAIGSNWPEIKQKSFILLDGDGSAGKSKIIAPALVVLTQLKHIRLHPDNEEKEVVPNYLMGNGQRIPDQVKYEELRQAILEVHGRCILDMQMALEIEQKLAKTLSIKHDYHIFVKRHDNGCWQIQQFLESPKRKCSIPELVEYYRNFKPLETCDRILISDLDQETIKVETRGIGAQDGNN